MQEPYFSIVTATLNVEKYLPKMLESVNKQTFRNFEHIFVDSYSTDKTLEIINQYKIDNPNIKVSLFQTKPEGVFVAQNVGIKKSKGRYINLMNSDDYFLDENVLKDVYEVTKDRKEIGWLQGDTVLGGKKSYHIRNRYLVGTLFHLGLSVICPILPQSTFMTKALYEKYGYFNTHRKTGMDNELFVKMSTKETIYFFDRKIAHFTIRPDSVSFKTTPIRTWSRNWVEFFFKYGRIPILTGIIHTFTKWKLRKFV